MKELKNTSTNGRWGLTVVVPNEFEGFPAKGSLDYLGQIEGHETYQFDPDPRGQWIELVGDAKPLAGCEIVRQEDLQSSNVVTLLIGGDFYAYKSFGYKRRKVNVVARKDGQSIELPASVLAAMGIIPAERQKVEAEAPPLNNQLKSALEKAGL